LVAAALFRRVPPATEVMMPGSKKSPRSEVVAFKVEEELAEFLNGLPNKSDFIRRAIYAQLGVVCPLCKGSGSVTREKHDHFSAFLAKWDLHHCESCGDEFALPKETGADAPPMPAEMAAVAARIQAGEPEFCFTCITKAGDADEPG
jgi:hypothetical protein